MPTASATSSTRAATITASDPSQLEGEPDLVAHALGGERLARLLQDDADALGGVARGNGGAGVTDDVEGSRDDPPSRCVKRPLIARSTVDFPDPVAPRQHREGARREHQFVDANPRSAGVRDARVSHDDGRLAVARHGGPRESAQLERGRDGRRARQGALQHGGEHPHASALAAQTLGEAHRAHGIGEGWKSAPRHGEGAGDSAQRAAPRASREQPRQVEEGVDEAEGEDRQRDREGARRGIPESPCGDRTEQHDVRERGSEAHRGQRQHDGA